MRAVQKDLERIGAEGCYFLSIIKAAEEIIGRYVDAYQVYIRALDMGHMKEDCYLVRPEAILSMITGGLWTVTKEAADYKSRPGEIVVERYERKTPSGDLAHFVLPHYDPYGDSRTRREGQLVSTRVFRRK